MNLRMRTWLLTLAVSALAGCDAAPTGPSPSRVIVLSGKIDDAQAASDIIAWNMKATGGSAYRSTDLICRWDLPVPVHLAEGPDSPRVIAALDYWQAEVGITYRRVASDDLPRARIRFGTDGLASWGGGRGGIDGTYYANNQARSALVVYEPGGGVYCEEGAESKDCISLYRHELGHVFGIFSNTGSGLMGSDFELSAREKRMIAALYSLPHGAVVNADGTWQVFQ